MRTENANSKSNNRRTWSSFLTQINVCFTVWGLYFISGFPVGAPTVVVPQLRKEANDTNVVSESMHSWIASISCFSGTGFVFVFTFMAHFFGRQKTMFFASATTLAASALLYSSSNAVHVLISQVLYGNVYAAVYTTFPFILTEYSSTKYRGIFLAVKSATFYWGIWTANVIGIFSHYKYIGLLGIIISCCCFINSFFLPESPYWLAFNGKFEECVLAHRLLKGEDESAEKELSDLITMQKQRVRNKKRKSVMQKYVINYFNIVKQPEFFKPVVLSSLVFLIYHLSGKLPCAVYAVELMRQLTGSDAAAHGGVLLLDGVSVLGMYIGCGVSKIVKRRTILLVNSTVCVAFLFMMALYLYLVKLSVIVSSPYLITTFLVGFSLAVCCGPAIMASTIFGELLPIKARSFSVCTSASLFTIYYGLIVKVAPLMFKHFDIHGTFLAYGISCTLCIILAYKFLPETKDRSLYEIAALFENKEEEVELSEIKPLKEVDKTPHYKVIFI